MIETILKITTDGDLFRIQSDLTLKSLQSQVGGNIECFTAKGNIVAIVDEEGKCKNKPLNLNATALIRAFRRFPDCLAGDMLLAGSNGEELEGLEEEEIDRISRMYKATLAASSLIYGTNRYGEVVIPRGVKNGGKAGVLGGINNV